MKTELTNKVLEVCKKLGITFSTIKNRERYIEIPGANEAAIEILEFAGIPHKYAHAAVHGIPETPQCENELASSWNWSRMHDTIMLGIAIEFAEQYMKGNQRCEVGMKYPEFRKSILIKKYNLTITGTFEPVWSRERLPKEKTFYEVWQNPNRTIQFSFEAGRMGIGGYAGMSFPTLKEAYDFVVWYFKHKSFYVKDVDLFTNGLGGLNVKEFDKFNLEFKQYNKSVKSFVNA